MMTDYNIKYKSGVYFMLEILQKPKSGAIRNKIRKYSIFM